MTVESLKSIREGNEVIRRYNRILTCLVDQLKYNISDTVTLNKIKEIVDEK